VVFIAAALVALLLCLAASRPALAPSEASPPAASGPVTAFVKLYLNDIIKFDVATGFTADVFVALGCETACGDPRLVVDNGKASSREVLLDTPNVKGYRMELAMTDTVDLHQYPFDSHALTIVQIIARPAEEIQFATAPDGVRVGDIRLQGWDIERAARAEAYVAPFDEFTARSIPVYQFTVNVSRPALAGFLKVMLPGFAILLVGSLGLIVGPEERIKRFDLFNAAFLGTVLFQLNVVGSLPPLGYLTYADRFLLVNLISIIIGVASSIMMILAFRAGRKARSWLIHEWSMLLIPLVWLALQSLNVLTVFVFKIWDWRILAALGAELLVSVILVIWYQRHLGFPARFRDAYRRSFVQSHNKSDALKSALDIFASEVPLRALSREEVQILTDVFGPLPDPLVLTDVLEGARTSGDVEILKNRAQLERFAAFVTDRKEPASAPIPSPAT
jgi:hypothetical protein